MWGEIFGWAQFIVSVLLVLWVLGSMLARLLPAWLATFFRRSFNLSLNILDAMGGWAINLIMTLWRGPAPVAPARPLSTVSQARPFALMSRYQGDAPDQPADRGLSGLSAADPPPAPLDPGEAWIESLDTYSREQAVAILVAHGWPVGKIRLRVTGDNGEIGREAAEARRRLGLDDDEPPARQTPLAGRELADGVEFRRQAAP